MIGPIPASWGVAPDAARARAAAPGIWRLRLPSAYWHIDHSNAYLIEGTDGPTLVDCGPGSHPTAHRALELAFAETGHRVEDVAHLVITHYHCDHVGAAAWVADRSGCEVWVHPARGHFTDAMHAPEAVSAKRWRRAAQEGVPGEWLDLYASVAEELGALDGEVAVDHDAVEDTEVPSGAGAWRVVETPGHAPSHIGVHHPGLRALISGDLVFAGFAPYYDYGCTPDPVAEFLASLDRLEALDPDLVMPGHGRPMVRDEIAVALATHRAGVHERLDAVRGAMRAGAANAWEVLVATEPELAAVPRGAWAFGQTLAYLRHLRLRGEVCREQGADGHFRHAL